MTGAGSVRGRGRGLEDSSWTRPLQLVCAAYGTYVAVLSLILVIWAEAPSRNIDIMAAHGLSPVQIHQHLVGYPYGVAAQIVESLIYLRIAWACYRGRPWAFWLALIAFTITGLGAFWVPLRPEAHSGLDTPTLLVHALANDLPGVIVAAALLLGLVRYRHPWARQRPITTSADPHAARDHEEQARG